MSLLDYNKLCLGAKNETVYAFESLVNQSLGYTISTTENTNNKDNVSEHIVSTFTTDLYDKTLNISEINNYKPINIKEYINIDNMYKDVITNRHTESGLK